MKDKFVEWVRRLLLKTVLPIRKRVNKLLSQLNFSIVSRISYYYIRLFIAYGVFFILMIYGVYILVQAKIYVEYADTILDTLSSSKVSYQTDIKDRDNDINPYYYKGVTLRVREKDTGKVLYNDITLDVEDDTELLDKYSINYLDNNQFIVKDHYSFYIDNIEYEVYFQYNMTESLGLLQNFILWLIILYLILVVIVGKVGRRGVERLLTPIKSMSLTANRLTVNNLHSERLNIEGTKNELKDLAATINKMLDRIDLSYESQKQFVSDASHELRTPIAVIQGYASMLERWGSEDKEVLKESIEAINKEAKSMQDLVEKLLFLSRHDKKTLNLSKVKFNMRPLVEEMIRETKMVGQNRCIECNK